MISLFSCLSKPSNTQGNFKDDFNNNLQYFKYTSRGKNIDYKYQAGVLSSIDISKKVLLFKISPEDGPKPGYGPEVTSKDNTHFGTYSATLKIPDASKLQPNVGAIVGLFTYISSKTEGLSEIDFEWHLANPKILTIGTWTGFEPKAQRIERVLNLATGKIYKTEQKLQDDSNLIALKGTQNLPKFINPIADFDASARFYTYGFDWLPDKIVWWIIDPRTQVKTVLWSYEGSTLGIPKHATTFRANFWHTDNWAAEEVKNSLEKPKYPFELEIDWMQFKSMK